MRSPEQKAAAVLTWATVLLMVTGVAFAGLAAWTLVVRSSLPLELDGRVTTIELRHEKHPGVDDVWMVAIDGGPLRHFDGAVVDLLAEGALVEKQAWERTVVVDGVAHDVTLSDDARAMFVLAPMAVVMVIGLGVAVTRRRRREDVAR